MDQKPDTTPHPDWFAIRTRQDFRAEEALAPHCDEIFFPKERVATPAGTIRQRAVIPHVLFIKTRPETALSLEARGRDPLQGSIPFWIYRYPQTRDIQIIPQRSIDLLRLLTGNDTERCRVYTPHTFTPGERVRIIGGIYEGYEGFVKRIGRNRHVIVEIEGICMVILPFIHPDLLQKLD